MCAEAPIVFIGLAQARDADAASHRQQAMGT
jgi:hypothetical protein